MVWDPNFPLQTTNINQSTPQIRTNWNYIATTVGTDHFYNTGNATLDGHHQEVQLKNQGIVPLAANMDGLLYVNNLFSKVQPYYRNASTILQLAKGYSFTGNLNLGTNNVLDVANVIGGMGTFGPFVGLFLITLVADADQFGLALVTYNGGLDLAVSKIIDGQPGPNGITNLSNFNVFPNAFITVTSGAAAVGAYRASLIVMEF